MNEYQILAEKYYQMRRMARCREQAAREVGLMPQQFYLLIAIKGLPEDKCATVGVLAERLQIEPHSAVELINRLTERGLVERHRDRTDLRRVLIALTSSGESLLHHLMQAIADPIARRE